VEPREPHLGESSVGQKLRREQGFAELLRYFSHFEKTAEKILTAEYAGTEKFITRV
jgi:hypothetical protein